MRGSDGRCGSLFSYVDLEDRVPAGHPLRIIRSIADDVLAGMSARFEASHARLGRPSIPPERLLRALLLQAFTSIRSERQLMERLEFDLLLRWFVGLGIDDPVWDASTFAKNRDRLMGADAAAGFLSGVVAHPSVRRQMSREHVCVDGTLIDAWASMQSFRPKDEPGGDDEAGGRNADRDYRGERRSNETHASTTDPDARLYRKAAGQASRLCFIGTALMENTNGLAVAGRLTRASASRNAWPESIWPRRTSPRAAHWPATRVSTPLTLSPSCESAGSRRMSRRTPLIPVRPGAVPASTNAPRGTQATPTASGRENGSRRSSAG